MLVSGRVNVCFCSAIFRIRLVNLHELVMMTNGWLIIVHIFSSVDPKSRMAHIAKGPWV